MANRKFTCRYAWNPIIPYGAPVSARAPTAPRYGGQLMTQVYIRSGGKRLYPHLLRTLFFSEGVRAGKDINFLSAALNIDPVVALRNYNEVKAEETLKTLADFNRETLRPST
jgi:hypothetical protein